VSVITSDVPTQLRHATFKVPAAPESAGLARKLTVVVLRSWSSVVDEDATLLMLTELFTNALVHGVAAQAGRSARISVEVLEISCGLHVEVHDPDQGGKQVAVTRATPQAMNEFGHGLELVEAMSADWGWKDTPGGKYVYFDVLASNTDQAKHSAEATMATTSQADPCTVAHAGSR
jgi:anti-sigma regulatory factor (Ser/Thr protein kinase)